MVNYEKRRLPSSNYRWELYKIFQKLSDNDLIRMYHILSSLGLSGFVLSYCIEILEDRKYNIDNLPKRLNYDLDF